MTKPQKSAPDTKDPFEGIDFSSPFPALSADELGPPPPRVCADCGKPKPVDQFSPLNGAGLKGGPGEICEECSKSYPERARRAEKLKELEAGVHRLVAAASFDKVQAPRLSEIAMGMVERFQGVDGFLNEWHQQIQLAKEGSKVRLDQYYAIFKMLSAAAEERKEELDLTRMTEEELEQAITGYVLKIVRPDEVDEREDGGADNPEGRKNRELKIA